MTTIEWFVEQMEINHYISKNAHWLIDKAKEMEKKQIIDAFNNGYRNGENDGGINKSDIANYSDAQHYYNDLQIKK
jgi:predicted secreted protein